MTDFDALFKGNVFVDHNGPGPRPNDWWQRFYGSLYVYPDSSGGLSQATRGEWHIQGTVSTWSGFGFWLGACTVDMSRFRGVSFRLWGDAGPTGRLTFAIPTDANTKPERCRSNVGHCDAAKTSCRAASRQLRVPPRRGEPVVILWQELRGGAPEASVDPSTILQFQWQFDWSGGMRAQDAYPVSLFVDDVKLVL